MIKNWSVKQIASEISKIAFAEKDQNMTGYITWKCKQDLYQLKWLVDYELERCSTYAEEEEYVRRHEKRETLRRLSK